MRVKFIQATDLIGGLCRFVAHNSSFFAHNSDKGGVMDDKFLCGIILGMLGGAVLATNSAKARQMVRDGQEQVKDKLNEVGKRCKNCQDEQ